LKRKDRSEKLEVFRRQKLLEDVKEKASKPCASVIFWAIYIYPNVILG